MPRFYCHHALKATMGRERLHHEGRSWRGFHHHACLVMLAFGFLASEREREERDPARPGKEGAPGR
jgi:SRSO17 transposase